MKRLTLAYRFHKIIEVYLLSVVPKVQSAEPQSSCIPGRHQSYLNNMFYSLVFDIISRFFFRYLFFMTSLTDNKKGDLLLWVGGRSGSALTTGPILTNFSMKLL